ncbi:MAG: efflux RND transporter periplasmic adaptor subunit [Desulfobacterales bacterium]|jgi:membrane fusion protein (multidrug efflux system)|nr:efflux RND transporter periplasmic adaptor subunit [Desulfobacterales bacterium]
MNENPVGAIPVFALITKGEHRVRPYKFARRKPGRDHDSGQSFFFCLFLFAFHALAISILWFSDTALAESKKDSQDRPPVVTVTTVVEKEVNPPDDYVGRVEAIQAVDLRARVEGVLEQVKFKEGGEVHAGDLLYVIEQAPYRARVNEALAKVADAAAALTKASQYLKRLRTVRSGGVSATDLDTALSTELQAKAKLQEAKAGLEQAEIDLAYTWIKAPINGRIGRTAYTRGNLVGPGSEPLARIVQIDPIRVVYSISDFDSVRISADVHNETADSADCRLIPRIRLPDGTVYPATGRFDFMDNQVDSGTGSIAVRAVFDNAAGTLLPGQYVTVQLTCKTGKHLPAVPQAAVQEDREGRYVLVVDARSQVQQRRITTGGTIGADWSVESGLVAGEMVIVQGTQKVRPGQRVDPVSDISQRGE